MNRKQDAMVYLTQLVQTLCYISKAYNPRRLDASPKIRETNRVN